jgi:hypothetical protein
MSNEPASVQTASVSRLEAVRHLFSRHQFKETLAFNIHRSASMSFVAGGQVALTTLIALPIVHFSPWSHLIGYASLGALAALFGRFAPESQRNGIVFRCAFWLVFAVFSMSLATWLGTPMLLQIAILALECGLYFWVATAGSFGPPGPLIFIFAASASMGDRISSNHLIEATVATALGAALAFTVCAVTERFRARLRAGLVLPSDPVPPISERLSSVGRIVIASAVAALVALALGAEHPAWAAMGALAVLQASRLHVTMNRSLQRMVGTTVGALLVGLVLAQSPSIWLVFGLLLLLMIATEIVIGTNYGLGQILVTPMALLMTYLANPQFTGDGMICERIWDTLLGAGIGIAIAILGSTVADRGDLAEHHARRKKKFARA